MQGHRVLFLDESPHHVKPAVERLTAAGYEVRTAMSVRAALEVLDRWEPRIVVVSARPGGPDPLALMRVLRTRDPQGSVPILVSGPAISPAEEREIVQAGGKTCVQQPSDPSPLCDQISSLLEDDLLGDSLADLRRLLCETGAPDCRRLLAMLPVFAPGRMLVPAFDLGYAKQILHQWAGAGGSVGLPQVTTKAREAETLLSQPFERVSGRVRELLTELLQIFETGSVAAPAVVKTAEPKPQEPAPPPPAAAAPVVLVCDDDLTLREVMRESLERSGFACRLAEDGRVAFAIARNDPPDLLILDVNLPGMDGFNVLSGLRRLATTRNLRVILVTGRREQVDILRGMHLGADAYIVKPFQPSDLINRVKGLLASA